MIIKGPSGEEFVAFQIGQTEAEIVQEIFELTLHNNFGSRTKTARALGLSVRTVRNRIKKYKLKNPDEADET